MEEAPDADMVWVEVAAREKISEAWASRISLDVNYRGISIATVVYGVSGQILLRLYRCQLKVVKVGGYRTMMWREIKFNLLQSYDKDLPRVVMKLKEFP